MAELEVGPTKVRPSPRIKLHWRASGVMGDPVVEKPPLVTRRQLLTGATVAVVGITVGVAVRRVLEMSEEATARKREALKKAFVPDEEAYMLSEVIISVNLRDKAYGPGTREGDSAVIIKAGKYREKRLGNALVVRRNQVTVGKIKSDLWIASWDNVREKIWYASVAAINDDGKYTIDINSLTPGKLIVTNDANMELLTLDNERVRIGLDPK
ncbi:MAG: hypothetical protein Q7S60_05690 [bacterium]|nr:hypothetical protein [bacterium]